MARIHGHREAAGQDSDAEAAKGVNGTSVNSAARMGRPRGYRDSKVAVIQPHPLRGPVCFPFQPFLAVVVAGHVFSIIVPSCFGGKVYIISLQIGQTRMFCPIAVTAQKHTSGNVFLYLQGFL